MSINVAKAKYLCRRNYTTDLQLNNNNRLRGGGIPRRLSWTLRVHMIRLIDENYRMC